MVEGLDLFVASARDAGEGSFVWGVSDCTLWVANWCVVRFGFDPAEGLRGTYEDEAGAVAVTGDDLAGFVGARLGPLIIKDVAEDGDVAIIRAFGRDVAAIRNGPFWVVKSENGVAMLRAPSIRIWGL